jgi:hypothetical protein
MGADGLAQARRLSEELSSFPGLRVIEGGRGEGEDEGEKE